MSLPCRSLVDGSWIWKKNSSSSRNEITSGSKTISTASAWSPWFRYVALGVSPPEYPTRLARTPGRLRSSSWAPQKQPPARIAVSVVTCASFLFSTTGEHRDPSRCFLLGARRVDVPQPRREHGWAVLLGSRVPRLVGAPGQLADTGWWVFAESTPAAAAGSHAVQLRRRMTPRAQQPPSARTPPDTSRRPVHPPLHSRAAQGALGGSGHAD